MDSIVAMLPAYLPDKSHDWFCPLLSLRGFRLGRLALAALADRIGLRLGHPTCVSLADAVADTVPWHAASFCAINSELHTLSSDVADSAKLALILAAG